MRYRVLIAEDESEIGRVLREMVQAHPRFIADTVAVDGFSAMERFLTGPVPDILLTDIQMPGYDGLELLAFVKEHYSQVKCVIVSAFSSFEYARASLHYGAFEYLLKPVTMEKLQTLLDALAQTLDHEKEQEPWNLSMALSVRMNNMPKYQGTLFLLAAAFGNYSFLAAPIKKDYSGLSVYVANAGVGNCETLGFGYKNSIHYLLLSAPNVSDAASFFNRLRERMMQSAKHRKALTCIMSIPIGDDADISVIGANLADKINNCTVFLCDRFINLNDSLVSQPQGPNAYQLFVIDEALASSLRSNNQGAFEELLKQKLNELKQCSITSSLLLEYLKYLYIIVGQQLFPHIQGNDDSTAPIPYDWEQRFQGILTYAESWDDLYTQCLGMFSGLFNAVRATDTTHSIAHQMESFICEHFSERISNQSLARQFGFVPSYISKRFKEYKGISPCDFLVKVRIENAQRIISEKENLNISEIALAVGFSDAGYFSKVFKRMTGLTPSEYKDHK